MSNEERATAASAEPLIRNGYDVGDAGGEVYFHPDGPIGTAITRMGAQATLDVDGSALGNVLGRLVTSCMRGELSTQAALDQFKAIHEALPAGPARTWLGHAIKDLDAPDTPVPDVPAGTPDCLRNLVAELHAIPAVRRTPELELERVLELTRRYAAAMIGLRGLADQVSRLQATRHESEGDGAWTEIRMALAKAAAALDLIARGE